MFSSRAMFNLDENHAIFENEGVDAVEFAALSSIPDGLSAWAHERERGLVCID
ncbi:MAG: hypothetical protein Q8P40_13215 [Nitrospirota bacterium]|nr:hypothetical protein [Nitrospirota bacterium]